MLKELLQFLEKEQLLDTDSRVLLAVSGGLDSVVMAHLFLDAGLDIGIGHCNFQLRGQASDEDEAFVLALAKKWGIPVFTRRFDTAAYAIETGQSIQVAARALRYDWLEKVRQEKDFTHIATAHHLNDSIETLLLNLIRGCGIRGLHGIPVRNGSVIRPLLFARREQLEQYAANQGLSHREDTTNQETKYQRNKIRLQAIPVLKEINPALEQTMAENIERFGQLEHLVDWAMRHIAQDAILSYGNPFRLSIKELNSFDSALPTVLFEFLHPYGFNSSQVHQLAKSLDHTGAIFLAPGYRLLVEREEVIVKKINLQGAITEFQLTPQTRDLNIPDGRLSLSRQEGRPKALSGNGWQAFLDADELQFPLKLRHWKAGDVFEPLGMEGKHQKLQDFFNNQKVSRFDKEKIWILEDAKGRICWVAGHRIDERFKITASTRAHWAIELVKAKNSSVQ